MFQERKGCIEVTAAHSYSMVSIVESNNRRDHNIEHSGSRKFAVTWLQKAKFVTHEIGFGPNFAKLHSTIFFDDGRENALFSMPRARNYFPGVHLSAGREIARDVVCTSEKRCSDDLVGDQSRSNLTFVVT